MSGKSAVFYHMHGSTPSVQYLSAALSNICQQKLILASIGGKTYLAKSKMVPFHHLKAKKGPSTSSPNEICRLNLILTPVNFR
jgi:hypothetical protein